VELKSKQQSGEKTGKRERQNTMQPKKPIKCNASRSKEAGILKTFCVENEGPSRKEQQRIEKSLGKEIVASSCVSKAARRSKQRNRENDRARQKLEQAPR
jgi:hypothetical protein